jgi:hypothetical protein
MLASFFFLLGCVLGVRFLFFHFSEPHTGHVQSLILAAIFLIVSFVVLVAGLLADLVGANRKLLEDIRMRLRRLEYRDAAAAAGSSADADGRLTGWSRTTIDPTSERRS